MPYPSSFGGNETDAVAWKLTIQGTLLDTMSRPIASALVAITDASGMSISAVTDQNGTYKVTAHWLNFALVKVQTNPPGYSNGPFISQATIASSVDYGVIVMPPVSPTPIKA